MRGRRTSVTDQNGKTTSYAYDDADRLITVTDAAQHATNYGYDTESNLTSITDANGNETMFSYDQFGRVTRTSFPSSSIETYVYDANNNLTSKTDRKGQTISYSYDQSNRLVEKLYPDSTTVNYTYDLDSRLTQVVDPTGTYTFTFDNMGRLTAATSAYSFLAGHNFTSSYTYDAASNRSGYTAPDGSTNTYNYDTLNRLSSLGNSWAGTFGFSYDALSRRTQMTRPNGINTNYSYDNLSRLLSVLHQTGSSTLDGATYTLDAAGNRTSKQDWLAGVTSNYTYDANYQLTQVTQGTSTTESYSYDPVGNRLSSIGVSQYVYNASNELTATSNTSYTYDANGNTISKTDSTGTTTYSWDFENRLTSVTLPGSGGSVSFKHDPFGRRIYKSSPSTASIFAYDGENLIEETNASGTAVARYAQGPIIDETLAELQSSATVYPEQDGLNTVTSLSSGAGALSETYTFDSFGSQAASNGSVTNPFQYTGRELDLGTGLYYYRARYYDSHIGRFLSEDPIRAISRGVNFYGYVQNDVSNLIDPSGLAPECPCAAAARLRLVPISDCSYRGYRRIVYELQGPGAASWWVTEHQNPPWWAPATPGSPQGQSTGNENNGPGGFDDTIFGFGSGNSLQQFTVSPEDPRKSPNTISCPVTVQLPSGPNGKSQDFGTLGIWHGGSRDYTYINGNRTGWVPCSHSYDEPGRQ